MRELPTLVTERLVLRPFRLEDAPAVQRLAGAREIAENTLLVPHPYPDGVAEDWISTHPQRLEEEKEVTLAITLRESGEVMGAIGLVLKLAHDKAEIGYWIGMPYWGRGYTTEAARAIIQYGFDEWSLHRIEAFHFARNPASGRVLQKLGMRHEGTMRGDLKKWGEYLDTEMYGVLREEWSS